MGTLLVAEAVGGETGVCILCLSHSAMVHQSHHRLQIPGGNAASHDNEPQISILHLGSGKSLHRGSSDMKTNIENVIVKGELYHDALGRSTAAEVVVLCAMFV